MKKQIVYTINGTVATAVRRMVGTKTLWIITMFILTAADRWNRGEITSQEFFQMTQIGVIGILIRAALSRAELAANAANPAMKSVAAELRDRPVSIEIAGAATCVVISGALLGLTACTTTGLTGALIA